MTGRKFGRWTVIKLAEKGKQRGVRWKCKCSCGNIRDVLGVNLLNTKSQSCGCLRIETNTKHGMEGTEVYTVWSSMLARCRTKTHEAYKDYGGRGIAVCSRWLEFENFLADMGERPKGLSIERIDNDGNYEPSNCKWATRKEQGINQRSNHNITYNGQTHCVSEWARILGISRVTLSSRLRRGWPVKRALNHKKGGGNDRTAR